MNLKGVKFSGKKMIEKKFVGKLQIERYLYDKTNTIVM